MWLRACSSRGDWWRCPGPTRVSGGYLGFAAERDATRILQFAVNTVIYALTQEGSMTQRLMQIVH